MFHRSTVIIALGLCAPLVLGAQAVANAPGVLAGMASDLRNLVVAQEAYFAENDRYAPDMAALSGYKTSRGNTARFIVAEPNRWGAEVRAEGIGGSCVISINLPAERMPRTAVEKKTYPEGEPACDGDGQDEATRFASQASATVARALMLVGKLQERHFGKTGAYATSLDQLEGLRRIPEVTITLEVTPPGGRMEGFFATGTHARHAGQSCVLRSGIGQWMGRARTAAESKRPTGDLAVTCDTFK